MFTFLADERDNLGNRRKDAAKLYGNRRKIEISKNFLFSLTQHVA